MADHPTAVELLHHTCQVFVHPQTIWRAPIARLVKQFDLMDLTLCNVRAKSGMSLLMLKPANKP